MTAAAHGLAAEPEQGNASSAAVAGAAQRKSAQAARVLHFQDAAAGAAIACGPQRLAAALAAARAGPDSGAQAE
jgi:hypothetical protein